MAADKQNYKARTKDRPYMRLRLEEAVEELSVF